MTALRTTWIAIAAAGALSAFAGAQQSVVNSPHNLSASGPGSTRAASESEVCIFCHAPHNATPVRPLWNRSMPIQSYTIYTSPALDATPGQPTGTSKMCLSCHDGTIAIGAVVSRDTPIVMSGGVQTIGSGKAHIGTDLSDDHPISFRFDSSLAARDAKLRSPASLPEEIRLDPNGEMQCTSCHDAHNNQWGAFLVMQNLNSELCTACHTVGTTTLTAHSECIACHQSHTAPSGPFLLRAATVTETCNLCHDGSVFGAANVKADLNKLAVHDTESAIVPAGREMESTTCTSCHDPHTMGSGAARAPGMHPSLGRIDGVNSSGSPVDSASSEHEVCFKCHADGSRIIPLVNRQVATTNTRQEFSPTAVSFHPIITPGRNSEMPSLLQPWNTSSVMHCSDCHASDAGPIATGVTGAIARNGGVHGSNFPGLLSARYETDDYTAESTGAYALCYKCHDRNNLLNDRASSFPGHRMHIVDQRTPCSACHDSHGIPSTLGSMANNSNLINFDTRIVQPNARGRLEYLDTGRFRGECFLRCHGVDHEGSAYEQR